MDVFITRRDIIGGVTSSIAAGMPWPASAASTAQTIFMIDAIKNIRGPIGLPTSDDAIRKRPLENQLPKRWGGVCIPVPFADFDWYYTDGPITWLPNKGQNLPEVTVPRGFCCDLTSIPQFFWSFGLPKTGRYAYAAIVHDYLYWDQRTSREVADEILYTGMIDAGVGTITREAISFGVAQIPYFAQNAWDKNTKARKDGSKRFLKVLPPRNKIISWAEWSKDRSHFSD